MAKENKPAKFKKIQEAEGSGFGSYKESTGGGIPFKLGDSNTRTTRENGKLRQENNPKTNQPRTKDGKFSYKSLNGESIDPKYGPSRGKTVNPLLTGGENGVMIDDVEKSFSSKSGSVWDKYKDKWYRKGSEVVLTDLKTRITGDKIWEVAKRRYDEVKGEFLGESEVYSNIKSGKKSKEEKAAIEEVKKTGEQANVIDQATGAIKLKPGTIEVPYEAPKPKVVAPKQPMPSAPSVPEEKGEEEGLSVYEGVGADKKFASGKYTWAQGQAVKEHIKKELEAQGQEFDESMWTDEAIEELIDAQGGDKVFKKEEPKSEEKSEPAKEEKEEDSEKIKKIKEMGFGE